MLCIRMPYLPINALNSAAVPPYQLPPSTSVKPQSCTSFRVPGTSLSMR